MHIVTLGEILIDMFPAEVGRPLSQVSAFHPKPGGAPANVAVAAHRLGAQTAFIGKVGDDAFGHYLQRVLADEGVETCGMRVDDEARTTMAIIAMPDPHTAEFIFYRNPGADLRLRPDELDLNLLRHTRALHIGSLSLVDEPARSATLAAVKTARQHGALISFDVNYRPSLWPSPAAALAQIRALIPLVDLLKVNEVELALLAGEGETAVALQTLLALGPTLCLLTRGKEGSYAQTALQSITAPAFPVTTVDATGCGDAFIAGVLFQLTQVADWRSQLEPDRLFTILRFANAVGALTAQTQGVIPALPTALQVQTFFTHQSEIRNPQSAMT
ncbi:MAG: carbohydrate kinase [Chloroflexi bacterium]|nr:carbohydrate kinase [Chloroflexota bacterium]